MVAKNPAQKLGTSRRSYDRKVRKKETFGVQSNDKKHDGGKKAAALIAAAVLASATIAVPAVIYYQKNFGYRIKIESVFDGEFSGSYTQKLKRGSSIGDINPPDKSGWYFAGFYSDENLSQQLDPDTKITEDTTIYLHYIEIKYHLDLSKVHVNNLDALSFSLDGKQIDSNSILHYGEEFLVTIRKDNGYLDTLSIDGATDVTQQRIDEGRQVEPNQRYFVVSAGNTDVQDIYLTVNFERESLLFNVTFFDFDGSSNQFTNVEFNTPIPVPTHKDRQDTKQYKYKFLGWAEADNLGNPIDLDEEGNPNIIPQQDFDDGAVLLKHNDMYFVAIFEQTLQEYELTIKANPPAVAQCVEIYIEDVKVTDQNDGQVALYKVKYGQQVTVTYSQREGWHKSSFTIGGVEQNANSVTFTMQDDIVVRYEEEKNVYLRGIGEIPDGVTVTAQRDGKPVTLKSFDDIEHFELLTFTYSVPDSHEVLKFTVNGEPIENGGTWEVKGAIKIVFETQIKTFVVDFPKQVSVTKDGTPILNNQRVEYGSELAISYQESVGYEKTKFLVDGKPHESGKTIVVTNDVHIEYEEQLKTYKMGTIPAGVTVIRQESGEEVHTNDTITHFEKLTISYELDEGYHKTTFCVNGKTPQDEKQNSLTIEVDGEVNIIFTQDINVYSVEFRDEDKLTPLDTQSVEWGKPASTSVVPSKDGGLIYIYTFDTWVDEQGEEVDLSSIKQDMVVYASYTAEYIEYSFNLPDHVTVTFISGNSTHTSDTLTKDDKLYYGDRVRVSYVSSVGYTRTKFKVGENVIEPGQTAVEVTILGNLTIEYEEAINVYKMGEIPSGVTVTRQEGGSDVHTGDDITHFEKLTIHYDLREGYSLIDFKVNGIKVSNDYVHTVEGQFSITFVESINKYSLGEIPEGVTVTKNGVELSSNTELEHGDEIEISYKLSTGKHLTRFAVNGKEVNNNYKLVVKKEVSIEFIEDYDTFEMLAIPKGVTVTRVGGQQVHEGDTITYNETLTVAYSLLEGYHRTTFVVAGNSIDKQLTSTEVVVTGAFTIEFEQAINQYIVHFYGEYNDGHAELIKDVTVNWGESASTDTPTKKGNEIYEYKFDFWANEHGEKVDLSSVKAETTVYAHFEENYVKYYLQITGNPIIIYKDGTSGYEIGKTLTAEDSLHYDDTIEISYTESIGHQKQSFKIDNIEQEGNNIIKQIKGNLQVEYAEVAIKYDVTFYDYEGEQLHQIKVEYGNTAVYPAEDPVKPANATYYYEFIGWSASLDGDLVENLTITGEASFYAKYAQHYNEYSLSIPSESVEVMFVSGPSSGTNSGELSNSSKLYYGDIISITRTPPQGKEESSFSFTGLTLLENGNYQVTGNVTISYEEKYIEYNINIPYMEDHLTIEYLSGTSGYGENQKLTSSNTLHLGDTIRVTYRQSDGFTGKLSVDGAQNLTDNQYQILGNLTLTYQETYIDYNINFPIEVTVMRDGEELETGAVIHINDQLQISYKLEDGYHATEFKINSQNITGQSTNYTVKAENIEITLKKAINTHTITFPSQVTVMADGQKLQSGAVVTYGQELIITYTVTNGFKKMVFEMSDGLTLKNRSENKYAVSALIDQQELQVFYEEEYIEYKLTIPDGVTVTYKSGGNENYSPNQPLSNGNTLHINDVIKVSYALGDDMELNYFTINNDQYSTSPQLHTVTGDVNITFDQVHAYLEFRQIEGGWEVSSLKNSMITSINIPSTYKNQAVISIGNRCFNNKNITQVTIGEGIAEIGDQAFANCSSLKSIVLPQSTTKIGSSAFAGTGITTITIPSGVESIGSNAFDNCKITSVVIDSASVYSTLSGDSADKLLANAITVKVKKSVVDEGDNEYFNNKANFRKTEVEGEDYYLFTASSTLQYTLTFNAPENVVVTYLSGSSGYSINTQLQSGNQIHYGDQLQIAYSTEVGHHLVSFTVNEGEFSSGSTLVVESDVNINYEDALNQHTLNITGDVTVSKDGEDLQSGDIVHFGDNLTITYTTTLGKTGTLAVGGLTQTTGNIYQVTATQNNMPVEVSYQEEWIEYTLTISDDTHVIVTFKSGNSDYTADQVLKTGSQIRYGDNLVVECKPTKGYKVTVFTIDDEDQNADVQHNISVTDDVSINYAEERNMFTINFFNYDGTTITSKDVQFEDAIIYDGETPTRTGAGESYKFVGWALEEYAATTVDLGTATESKDFYAVYEYSIATVDHITITYLDGSSDYQPGQALTSSNFLRYNDRVTITYEDPAVELESFTVNGDEYIETQLDNSIVYTVTDNIVSVVATEQTNLIYTLDGDTWRVDGFKQSVPAEEMSELEIPATYAFRDVTKIGDSAFESNQNLTHIVLGENVESIGDSAFESCTNLSSIKTSTGLRTIGNRSFYGSGLINIDIPEGVTTIGELAYSMCLSATSISIPESVISFGDGWNNGSFEYCFYVSEIYYNAISANDINYTPFKSVGEGTESLTVTFGEKVQTIPANLFNINCQHITKIIFNSTNLNSLSPYTNAFDNAGESREGISVIFGENVQTIPANLFKAVQLELAPKITSVTLGSNVKSIGENAFIYLKELTQITIPSSVQTIGQAAFTGCDNLMDVTINSADIYQALTSVDSCGFLLGYTDLKPTVSVPKAIVDEYDSSYLENMNNYIRRDDGDYYKFVDIYSIESDFEWSWMESQQGWMITGLREGKTITDLVIPDMFEGYKVFGVVGFKDNLDINTLKIGKNITRISDDAFNGCTNLQQVDMSQATSLEIICSGAFSNCTSLTGAITLPNGLTKLEGRVFAYTSITEVTIPESLINTNIANNVFSNCSKLSKVIINNPEVYRAITDRTSVSYLVTHAKTIVVPKVIVDNYNSSYIENINNFYIKDAGENYEFIDPSIAETDYTWEFVDGTYIVTGLKNTAITKVSIPSTFLGIKVVGVKNDAFTGTNITSVAINSNVTYIGQRAFYQCSKLTTVDLSYASNLQTIQNQAFASCESLNSLTFRSNLTTIGDYAFDTCTKLTTLSIPDSVTSIGTHAFTNGLLLRTVSISSSSKLQSIGVSAFEYCPVLTEIYIPSSVTSIGDNAFLNCNQLTTVQINSTAIYTAISSLESCGKLIRHAKKIVVAKTLADSNRNSYLETYASSGFVKSSTYSNYEFVIPNLNEYSSEFDYTYLQDELAWQIDGFRAGNTRTYIDGMPATIAGLPVISIKNSAFANSMLIRVTIGANIKTIGERAFSGCKYLATVNMDAAQKLETIKPFAFYDCSSLTQFKITKNVTSIGAGAFGASTMITTLFMDSPTICRQLTSSTACGNLVYRIIKKFYITTSNRDVFIGWMSNFYLYSKYEKATSDVSGYNLYTFKTS